MSNPADGAQKIAIILKPLMDELMKVLREHTTAVSQEILIALAANTARLEILEKLVAEKKKPITRGEKKVVDTANPETPIPLLTGNKSSFPVNKLVFFRDQFKTNLEYRAKYVTPEIKELIDKDPTILGKTKEDQKINAQAIYCWNYIKNNKADVAAAIEAEYGAAKTAHEAANKPPQQTVEGRSPKDDESPL